MDNIRLHLTNYDNYLPSLYGVKLTHGWFCSKCIQIQPTYTITFYGTKEFVYMFFRKRIR